MAGAPKGNKNAAKPHLFEGALRRALNESDRDALHKIALELVEKAMSGERWAVEMIADRLDGKAKNQTEIKGHVTNDHKHTHSTESVSETVAWLNEAIGAGSEGEAEEPVLN